MGYVKPPRPPDRSALTFLVPYLIVLASVAGLFVWGLSRGGDGITWWFPLALTILVVGTVVFIYSSEERRFRSGIHPSPRRRWHMPWFRILGYTTAGLLVCGPALVVAAGSLPDPLGLALWVVAILMWWRILVHPRIDLAEDELVVSNPLTRRRVLLHRIVSMEPGWAGLVVNTMDGVVKCRAFWEGLDISWLEPRRAEEIILTVSEAAGRDLRPRRPSARSTYAESYVPDEGLPPAGD